MTMPDLDLPSHGLIPLWELCKRLSLSPDRLRRDLRAGRIQATKPGTEYLFTVEQWMDAVSYYDNLGIKTVHKPQASE